MTIARTIVKNSLFTIISNFSESIVGFGAGIVLARYLGPGDYGLYAYMIWVLSLASIIVNLGVAEMSKRFIAEALGSKSTSETVGYAQLSLLVRGAASILVCLALIALSGFWARVTGNPENQRLFIMISFTVIPYALQFALISIFRGFQRYDYAAYVYMGTGPLRLVLLVVLLASGFGVYEALMIQLGIFVLGVLIGLFLLKRLIPLRSLFSLSLLSSTARKRALKYAITVALVLVLDFLAYQRAEVFFIELFATVEEVGFYNLAFRLAMMIMGIVPSAFAIVLIPVISEQFGKGDSEKIQKIFATAIRYMMIIALPLAVGCIVLAEPVITLLYGSEFIPAVILLRILIIPLAIFYCGNVANAVIYGINSPGYVLKVNTVMAIINISLNALLIWQYDVLGAAIAKAIPIILGTTLCTSFACRKIGVAWPVGDALKIVMAALIMGIAVYILQSQLGIILGIVLGVLLGVIIYFIAILSFRVIKENDLAILANLQDSIPVFLRKYYLYCLKLLERIILR